MYVHQDGIPGRTMGRETRVNTGNIDYQHINGPIYFICCI